MMLLILPIQLHDVMPGLIPQHRYTAVFHEPGFPILTWNVIIIATATFRCWAGICD
jgi:hypothetical protein